MSLLSMGMSILSTPKHMPISPYKVLNKSNFIDFSNPAKTEAMLAEQDLMVEQHNTLAYVLNLQKKANKDSLKNAQN